MESLVMLCVKAAAKLYLSESVSLQSLKSLPPELAAHVLSYFPPIMLLKLEEHLGDGASRSTERKTYFPFSPAKRQKRCHPKALPSQREPCSDPTCLETKPVCSDGVLGTQCLHKQPDNGTEKEGKKRRESLEGLVAPAEVSCTQLECCEKELPAEDGSPSRSTEFVQENGDDWLQSCILKAWEELAQMRWTSGGKDPDKHWDLSHSWAHSFFLLDNDLDWKCIYLERHLQECLNAATHSVSLSVWGKGSIGDICLPEVLTKELQKSVKSLHEVDVEFTMDAEKIRAECASDKHKGKVGSIKTLGGICGLCAPFTRRLRLQSIVCTSELADLLDAAGLQVLVVHNLRTGSDLSGLCSLLKKNCHILMRLRFIHCKFLAEGFQCIFEALHGGNANKTHKLQWFSLVSSGMFPCQFSEATLQVVNFVKKARALEFVELLDNGLDECSAALIYDAVLQSTPTFTSLHICDNKLGNEFAETLSSLKPNGQPPYIRCLDLRNNFLDDTAMESLVTGLKHMRFLEVLDLSGNPLSDSGIRALVPYFESLAVSGSSLLELNVSDCELSLKGGEALLTALSCSSHSVRILSISNNFLGSKISQPLSNYINKSSVHKLDVNDVGLEQMGCSPLLEDALVRSLSLTSLDISKNRIGTVGGAMLASIIRQGQGKLTTINATGNLFGVNALTDIASALQYRISKKTGSCLRLDLRNNPCKLSMKVQRVFAEAKGKGDCVVLFSDKIEGDCFVDDEV